MKIILFITSIFLSAFVQAQQNTLLKDEFWKTNPTVEMVKKEIEKGNDPTQYNSRYFDPVCLALINHAPIQTIQYLIEQKGNSIDKPTHDGRIYLHWAAMSGNKELVEYLIKKGSNIHEKDDSGATPILFAALRGMTNTEVYEIFFNAGVSPSQRYTNDINLLMAVIPNDNELAVCHYLVEKDPELLYATDKYKATVIDYAAKKGNINIIKKLIDKGVKYTPLSLIYAAQGARRFDNQLPIYQYLIEELNINPNTTNHKGENALHYILNKKNQTPIIKYLINQQINVNNTANNGETPLMIAAKNNKETLEIILPLTQNINALNTKEENALMYAISQGALENITYLIKAGVNHHIESKRGNMAFYLVESYQTPSNEQSLEDFTYRTQILLANGINLTTPQADGNNIYHLAVAKNEVNILNILHSLNITPDINHANHDGYTPLHRAAMMAKNNKVLKKLIQLGANKNIKTPEDETPFDIAQDNNILQKNNIDINFLK